MNIYEKKYVIRPSVLHGCVSLQGAKNSALRLLAASILTSDEIVIDNFPARLLDVQTHMDMLRKLDKECYVDGDSVRIKEPSNVSNKLDWEGRSIRNNLLILGALLARTGWGCVPLPGGCKIGIRKYDLHEMVFETLGARVWCDGENLYAEAPDGLKGGEICLPIRSTGATENALICASLAKGFTRIWNPHVRPEICDLIKFLNNMGADISVYGHSHIDVTGVEKLTGTRHVVIPDNVEAVTWIVASMITKGSIEIKTVPFEHLEIPMVYLRECGSHLYRDGNNLIVRSNNCFSMEISTGPYPGINSDMQPLFAALAVCAEGDSKIIDLRFPDRYAYTSEMVKMGASFRMEDNVLLITGAKELIGASITAPDIRAGAALALLGLVAKGETVIHNVWQIDRGYQDFIEKLQSLGGDCSIEQ
jgi:UDP-N-acetylglucosamine 1-carboxyvinyltransferase